PARGGRGGPPAAPPPAPRRIPYPAGEESRQQAPLGLLFGGHGPSRSDTHVVQPRIGHQLFDESGLPFPGLTLDDDDLPAPAARPLPRGRERRQLDAPAHERRA